MFWILAACLAALAGLFVASVLRGAPEAPGRDEAALAIFRDQLAEIDRDAARGLIGPEEAEAARVEVQRRMLRAARTEGNVSAASRRAPVLAAALAVPALGVALYLATGAPGTPSVTLAERASERAAVAEVSARIRTLTAEIEAAGEEARPGDRVALASALMSLGRAAEAVAALAPAAQREDAPSGVVTYYVEVSLAANGGRLTDEIAAQIARASRLDPLNPAVSFYRAFALEAEGDPSAAREALVRRLSLEREAPPWAEPFLAEIDRLNAALGLPPADPEAIIGSAPPELLASMAPAPAPLLPPGAAEIADLTPAEQRQAIEDMVDGLAARLEAAPDDPEGWLRLAQARAVLDQPGLARGALARAAETGAGDPEIEAAVEALRARIGD